MVEEVAEEETEVPAEKVVEMEKVLEKAEVCVTPGKEIVSRSDIVEVCVRRGRRRKKSNVEEDVCFMCYDGGELVVCDKRDCPKAYHPVCIDRDKAFFNTFNARGSKARWNCGWHVCNECEKAAQYMCSTCTYSLCRRCITETKLFCVRGNKGFCEVCIKVIMAIEKNKQGPIDFDDRNKWEYFFRGYWIDLKGKLSLTLDQLAQARNPWKECSAVAAKEESADKLYDANDDQAPNSESSSEHAEMSDPETKKAGGQSKSLATDGVSSSETSTTNVDGMFLSDATEWASKELLEFVAHMKDGNISTLSYFAVQALLLEYIKRHNLRVPSQKNLILCDSRLEKLFGKGHVRHFEMFKLLEAHFAIKKATHAEDIQGEITDNRLRQLVSDGNPESLTQADEFQGVIADNKLSQLDSEGNRESSRTESTYKRRKTHEKDDKRRLDSHRDDYVAVDVHKLSQLDFEGNPESLTSAGDIQGVIADNKLTQLDSESNRESLKKESTYKRRKTRVRDDKRRPQSNLHDYAAVDVQKLSQLGVELEDNLESLTGADDQGVIADNKLSQLDSEGNLESPRKETAHRGRKTHKKDEERRPESKLDVCVADDVHKLNQLAFEGSREALTQADDIQGALADNKLSRLEPEGNHEHPRKEITSRRRKTHKKDEERRSQSNLNCYAAVDVHNVNLIYWPRHLIEGLLEDTEEFHKKVVGSFVRARISSLGDRQDVYQLVQVIGTGRAAEPYKIGKRTTDLTLKILNSNKTETISIDSISDQEFSEKECECLRESIKRGLIRHMTVGEVQEKAIAIHAVRVDDWLEKEKLRLSHLRDWASEKKGGRQKVKEYVKELQLVSSPKERLRRLQEIPEVHVDPDMDTTLQSGDAEAESEKKRENYMTPKGTRSRARTRHTTASEPSRRMPGQVTLAKGDSAITAGEKMNESPWSQERHADNCNSLGKPRNQVAVSGLDKGALNGQAVVRCSSYDESCPTYFSTPVSEYGNRDKVWHYQDASGKIQGPFSMVQLRKWSTACFSADMRIWRAAEKEEDSILLTDALNGKFHKGGSNGQAVLSCSSYDESEPASLSTAILEYSDSNKVWHYRDASGNIQGPFSMLQLHKWSTACFSADMRIWKATEKEEDSILLTDALNGKFRKGGSNGQAVVSCSSYDESEPASLSTAILEYSDRNKVWHYRDASGKIQGPFSMMQLRKWSTACFSADMRIWRATEKEEDSILLTDALNGKFHK